MSFLSRIKALFVGESLIDIYEEDYRRTAAQLLRGQVDDLGEGYDLSGLTQGGMDAMKDFSGICNHFIQIGREKERRQSGLGVKNG